MPDKSPHILNTSATLLGLCFIVLTSLNALHLRRATIIDELTTVSIILFMSSCILAFVSISNSKKSWPKVEFMADLVFMCGLFSLFITTMLIAFNVVD